MDNGTAPVRVKVSLDSSFKLSQKDEYKRNSWQHLPASAAKVSDLIYLIKKTYDIDDAVCATIDDFAILPNQPVSLLRSDDIIVLKKLNKRKRDDSSSEDEKPKKEKELQVKKKAKKEEKEEKKGKKDKKGGESDEEREKKKLKEKLKEKEEKLKEKERKLKKKEEKEKEKKREEREKEEKKRQKEEKKRREESEEKNKKKKDIVTSSKKKEKVTPERNEDVNTSGANILTPITPITPINKRVRVISEQEGEASKLPHKSQHPLPTPPQAGNPSSRQLTTTETRERRKRGGRQRSRRQQQGQANGTLDVSNDIAAHRDRLTNDSVILTAVDTVRDYPAFPLLQDEPRVNDLLYFHHWTLLHGEPITVHREGTVRSYSDGIVEIVLSPRFVLEGEEIQNEVEDEGTEGQRVIAIHRHHDMSDVRLLDRVENQ
ncbi:hypothetical protein PROFUN_09915 [Planoprotostelium fungivorum]|uniref:Coilin n=1 Tax=Planoprotostelium fungivorum TaxID=1890364 RepID=A0A2P6NG85_9EUKA|nr:hypothetical protein PROFUN_09915 [Planoprotostelium fungivorum]